MDDRKILAGTHFPAEGTDQVNHVSFVAEMLPRDPAFLIDDANHPHRWRRSNCAGRILIIQTDVSTGYRRAKPTAGFSQTLDGFAELPEVFRMIRVPKVEVIRNCQGRRTRTNQIPGGFSNCNTGSLARIQFAIKTVAVSCRSDILVRFPDRKYSRVRPWRDNCSSSNGMIVLAEHPVLRSNRRVRQELNQARS